MSAIKGRPQRRPGTPTLLLQGRVCVEAHEAAKAAAESAGISITAYLEALVLADAEHHFVSQAAPYHQEPLSA